MNTLRSAIYKLELRYFGRNSILFYREEIHLKDMGRMGSEFFLVRSLVFPTTKITYINRPQMFING